MLAVKAKCALDEFDEMAEGDRIAIHEVTLSLFRHSTCFTTTS